MRKSPVGGTNHGRLTPSFPTPGGHLGHPRPRFTEFLT
jgi:hypothetical protein